MSFCVNCLSQTILREAFQCKNVQMVKFKERKRLRFWTIGEVQVLGGPGKPVCIIIIIIIIIINLNLSMSVRNQRCVA